MKAGNPKIFVIDDEQTIVSSMVYYFSRKGYEITGLSDPEEAVAALAQNGFDVVITDLQMEPISGFEIIEITRKRIPGVLLIAMSGKFTKQDAEDIGVDYFFEKPFLYRELEGVIKERFAASKGI